MSNDMSPRFRRKRHLTAAGQMISDFRKKVAFCSSFGSSLRLTSEDMRSKEMVMTAASRVLHSNRHTHTSKATAASRVHQLRCSPVHHDSRGPFALRCLQCTICDWCKTCYDARLVTYIALLLNFLICTCDGFLGHLTLGSIKQSNTLNKNKTEIVRYCTTKVEIPHRKTEFPIYTKRMFWG